MTSPFSPRAPINPRRRAGIGVGGCLALLVFAVAGVAFSGFVIMLLWGAIAPQFDGPTIGYGTAVLISLALSVVGGFFKTATS